MRAAPVRAWNARTGTSRVAWGTRSGTTFGPSGAGYASYGRGSPRRRMRRRARRREPHARRSGRRTPVARGCRTPRPARSRAGRGGRRLPRRPLPGPGHGDPGVAPGGRPPRARRAGGRRRDRHLRDRRRPGPHGIHARQPQPRPGRPRQERVQLLPALGRPGDPGVRARAVGRGLPGGTTACPASRWRGRTRRSAARAGQGFRPGGAAGGPPAPRRGTARYPRGPRPRPRPGPTACARPPAGPGPRRCAAAAPRGPRRAPGATG